MSVAAEITQDHQTWPMPDGPISGPTAWYGRDMVKSDDWLEPLEGNDIVELESALKGVADQDIHTITRANFPLPTLGPRLDAIRKELIHGRGFVLLRGIPVERYDIGQAARIYYGIGRYFGNPVSQNGKGHLLGHVIDLGMSEDDPNARIYQTRARQTFHTDSCDFVALLCLRKSRSGGLSSICSSVTVYNEMRKRAPELVGEMFHPHYTDRRGEVPPGRKPYLYIPVFNWHEGLLSTIYAGRYIRSARRLEEVPPLTEKEAAALDMFDAIADDPEVHFDMAFEPGDMQFLHNHQILHDRTEYVDWAEPEKRRHLLRLWLSAEDGRPLPEIYADRYNNVIPGKRGGINVEGAKLHAPLEP